MVKQVSNPPNPWSSTHVEWIGEPPEAKLEVYEEEAKHLIAENDSPDVGFRFGINPYRGCGHACAYCFARPSHQYLGFGAGTDFERRIVVKVNAPEALRRDFLRPSWKGELVALSGNTDCYQPLEASYRLTRGCLEVFREFRNPVVIITKGLLVRRDVDVLSDLAKVARVSVHVSIPFLDDAMAKALEPGAAAPVRRFEAMKTLADAGVPVGISLAPVIPGMNDPHIPELLQRAKDAGATSAFYTLLRLPAEVLPVFTERMKAAFPDRLAKVVSQVKDVRGGRMYNAAFGERMHGRGPRWDAIVDLFRVHAKRLGLDRDVPDVLPRGTFRRPPESLPLFPESGRTL
jgi:DNA repair photolyase